MPLAVRESIGAQIETAGARATATAPLVWLRMEPAGPAHAEVLLTTWPAGRERLVATAPFHGVSCDLARLATVSSAMLFG